MEDEGENDDPRILHLLFRNLRDKSDPFSMPDHYFVSQYRYTCCFLY